MTSEQQIIDIVEKLLAGDLPFLEGATRLCAVRFDIVSGRDPDFDVFVLIDSETDHLPREQQRQFWQSEALEKLQPEIEKSEQWARSIATDHCENIIRRFKRV